MIFRYAVLARRCFISAILIGLLAVAANQAHAQEPDFADKLDPVLQTLIERALPEIGFETRGAGPMPYGATDPASGKRLRDRRYPVFVETSRPEQLRQFGITPAAEFESFVTARLRPEQLVQLARLPGVSLISAPSKVYPSNDLARAETGASLLHRGALNATSYQGQGTLTCIIDSGIDWSHPDFDELADSTESRIRYLWDQTLSRAGSEQTPEQRGGPAFDGLDYGVEYTRSDIENEIDGSPAGFVRSEDTNGHGTHVAGTAAGSGGSLPSRRYRGMAPRSELVVVKAGDDWFSDFNVANGLSYCGTVAEETGKPVVANLSLGGHTGPHDGTSALDRAVDGFVEAGKVAVVSAGNEGDDRIHRQISLSSGDSASYSFEVPTYTPESGKENDVVELDIWADANQQLTAEIWHGDSLLTSQPSGGFRTDTTIFGAVYVDNSVNQINGDRRVYVQLFDPEETITPAEGTWHVRLINASGRSANIHGWVAGHEIGEESALVELDQGDGAYTVGSPGTASEAITVGAYAHRWRWTDADDNAWRTSSSYDSSDDIAAFSSRGPRRDGLTKPDIAAPGQKVGSAMSRNSSADSEIMLPGGRHRLMQGTSMAAPVVTGAVALLLQEESGLSASQARTALTATTRSDEFTGSVPNNTWGHGKVDAYAAMADLTGGTRSRDVLRYDAWTSLTGWKFARDVRVAVRFTPSADGELPGAFVHTSSTQKLDDSVRISVWSDDGTGRPGSQVGSAVRVEPERLIPYTWNYLDLAETGVSLSGGANYHLVVRPTAVGDTLSVLADTTDTPGRSNWHLGSGWSASGSAFRIRPHVAPLPTGANSAPLFTREMPDTTVSEGDTLRFTYEAQDSDGDGLAFSKAAGPDRARVSSGGTWTWTPGYQSAGTHRAQVSVTDGAVSMESRMTSVTVENVNGPPDPVSGLSPTSGTRIDLEGDEHQTVQIDWEAASDPDGDEITYYWVLRPQSDTTATWFTSPETSETVLTVRYDTLARNLTSHDVEVGETADLYHAVIASDGSTQSSSSLNSITLLRGTLTGIARAAEIPATYGLSQNYPNPFNPTTRIRYQLPERVRVTLRITDVLGRHVATLVDEVKPPGRYAISFDARTIPSGIYFYRLEAGDFTRTRAMVVVQ